MISKYKWGASVPIEAQVPEGYNFDKWDSNNVSLLADQKNSSTTITMPKGAVTLTANVTVHGEEYTGAFGYAVSVGVALDDRNDPAGGAFFGDLGGNGAVIMSDRLCVNLNPGAGRVAQRQIGIGYIKIMSHKFSPL